MASQQTCICRDSTGLQQLLDKKGCLLNEYKHNIHVVLDPATSGISSTILRQQLRYVSFYVVPSPTDIQLGSDAHVRHD